MVWFMVYDSRKKFDQLKCFLFVYMRTKQQQASRMDKNACDVITIFFEIILQTKHVRSREPQQTANFVTRSTLNKVRTMQKLKVQNN